jgi:O-6-methylguanine DNA methyltransferase
MTAFERNVLSVVSRIPVGRVATYGDVARMAGRPGAARAVGNIMQQATRPGLPYHRVIGAGGLLGGYSSLSLKRSLLTAEGLTVTPRRVVGFAKVRWANPPTRAKARYGGSTAAAAGRKNRRAGG